MLDATHGDPHVTGKCDSTLANIPGLTRTYAGPFPPTSENSLIFPADARSKELTEGGTQTANSPLSEDKLTQRAGTFAGRLAAYARHHRLPLAAASCAGEQRGCYDE